MKEPTARFLNDSAIYNFAALNVMLQDTYYIFAT